MEGRDPNSFARFSSIDAFRYIAFMFVVVLHCLRSAPDNSLPVELIAFSTKFAVPFFFITSGYFTGRGNPDFIPGIVKLLKRLSIVFIFWVLVYVSEKGQLAHLVHPKFLAKTLISGGPAVHLWFLPALGIGTAIILFFKNYGWGVLFSVAAVMMAIAMCLGSYRFALGLPETQFVTISGPFIAVAFILVGYYLGRKNILLNLKTGIILCVFGFLLQIAEEGLIAYLSDKAFTPFEFLASTIVYGTGVFLIALNIPSGKLINILARLGEASLGMYCIHLLFIHLLREFFDRTLPIENTAIIILSIILSTLSSLVMSQIPYLRKLVK